MQAAIEEEVQDWDSQQCKRLQADVFSSSAPPTNKNKTVASALSATNFAVITLPSTIGTTLVHQPSDAFPSQRRRASGAVKDVASTSETKIRQIHHILATFAQHRTAMAHDAASKDLDLTQRSSMSLTQENSCSAYELLGIRSFVPGQHASIASRDRYTDGAEGRGRQSADETVAREPVNDKEQHSTRTDLAPHTYTEDDTGHIVLEYHPEQDNASMEQADSQDASYALPRVAPNSQPPLYEPQTPAAPINPFMHKGSVLKGFEMFGATQPSSIGRHVASPTSSRPSPDVYHDFTSPPRHSVSSPLQRRNFEEEKIPVQSSLRNILGQYISDESPQTTTPRTSGIQSFDAERLLPQINPMPEPRKYNSMRASQERRKNLDSTPPESSSDGSDSDLDSEPRRRHQRRKRERDIQRQLSTVELHRRMSPTQPSSSCSALVEVPSTSTRRRRSIQDDSLAQCEGVDARDTQQDDFIADSQSRFTNCEDVKAISPCSLLPANSAAAPGEARRGNKCPQIHSSASSRQSSPPQSDPSHKLNTMLNRIPEADAVRSLDATSSKGHPEPSLPLQNVSLNRKDLNTPLSMKTRMFSDPGVATVPETSPAQCQIRPMGDIGLSFGPDGDEELSQNPPGFTQDDEFFDILKLGASPDAPPRARNSRKRSLDIANSPPHDEASTTFESNPSTEYPLLKHGSNRSSTAESDVNPGRHRPTRATTEGGQAPNHSPDDQKLPTPLDDQMELRSETELNGPSSHLSLASVSSVALEEFTLDPLKGAKPSSSANLNMSSSSELSSVPSSMAVTPASAPCLSRTSSVATPATRSSQRLTVPKRSAEEGRTLARSPSKRNAKRKSVSADENPTRLPPRASKRQSTGRGVKEDSVDPLSLPAPSVANQPKTKKGIHKLFEGMAFAVSYVKQEQEKDNVIKSIADCGGEILEDGFDGLFELGPNPGGIADDDKQNLVLAPAAASIGFVALIADEHSRKSKYMQALALGLPCISGRWIMCCISKGAILDWTPYLLCAGQSSFLGNVHLSRTLRPYSATEATLQTTFASRDKMLEGKSILLVMGKGRADDKRKTFMFLTRSLGPSRLGQVADYTEARRRLIDAESCGLDWDLLYVDNAKTAESTIFTSVQPSKGRSSKRKKGPTRVDGSATPTPKRVRVLTDEDMVQSLILGQLVEED
ncbi:uncharacterized protein BP5553_03067 [Venustampulla echinocandica]|uniref:BRCT domain-containing protein n=1 Tax=Venustampulla echinocandica TaxID=2656787 RepID=A0A370TT73_9HELO|nr:uncharacterized protein BP5553_03067 [Venustampulla echinocandica]RDL38727.1 hypothetical protein BP5553_03067 [Venustampulla echinocandica]